MKQCIKLNGVKIKTPPSFQIQRYNITKSNRLASGLMSMELVAQKRKFSCKWPALTSAQLNTILDIIWESQQMFFTFSYIESNVTKTATVYCGDLDTDLSRTDDVDWVWKDVEFHFIEQ